MNETILRKYAKLAVKTGANVQKDQYVVVNSNVDHADFTRLVVEEAYKAGASQVEVRYSDDMLTKLAYENVETELLKEVPSWSIDRYKNAIDKNCCFIHIRSTVPDLLSHIDSKKLQEVTLESSKAMKPYRYYTMANHGQWTIVAVPNPVWAKKIFPDLDEKDGMQALWEAILKTVHVDEDNDPVEIWANHNKNLKHYYEKMNEYNFKALHFTNNLGTDLMLELVENHIWRGGQDFTLKNVPFNPNMPTEEVFSMPKRDGVNGIVYATKPLNYQGKLIDKFWVKFKNGKVTEYKAQENEDALRNLLELDEGSSRLGEVALISFDTPISQSNILFYDTLFDENASCHLALGAAYPTNLKGGENMSEEELIKNGSNQSMTHNDFMFGSADMNIKGIKFDGSEVVLFENGNFVI
ncbi:MAG: aminopeptidase [Erysipelotrichaceae bacterium]|nr:aminopeptidase [Erysipelotrichaceae bacterium]